MLKKFWAGHARTLAECSVGLGFVLAVLLTCHMASFSALAASVRADTLRLHVQANSDSAADQQLKLIVRDAVLAEAARLFGGESSQAAALAKAGAALPALQRCAERAVAAAGSSQSVRVYLTNMYFDTTYYDDFTLPAGRYDALRVELGRHAGKNWFCVLYPALCLPAADCPAAYPAAAQQRLVHEPGYEVRFAALEVWQHLTGAAKG